MTIDDVALRVSAALGAAGVPFILVGGFSSNYHGIPRSTKDADFVVKLSAPLNQEFAHLLGPEFKADPQLSFETNTGTQRQEFRVVGTMLRGGRYGAGRLARRHSPLIGPQSFERAVLDDFVCGPGCDERLPASWTRYCSLYVSYRH